LLFRGLLSLRSNKMWSDLRASWALLLGFAFMMVGNGLQGTLLGVRATLEGFPAFTTGIMMSGYFIGILLGSMIAPRLVNRVGHIRVFAAFASLASISILIHGLYINAFSWMMMRIVTGICFAGFYVVTESWLNDRASNETRGKVLSVYMLITTIGIGSGQFLLNVANPESIDLFILISVVVSFGLIPILLTARPAPAFDTLAKMSVLELFRITPLAVISMVLVGVINGIIFGLGAMFASRQGFNHSEVAQFMASFMLGSLIVQLPFGQLSDRINRRVMIIFISVIGLIGCVGAIYFKDQVILFLFSTMLIGSAAMPLYSISIAYANDRLETDQVVAASGSLVLVSGIGLCIGPISVSYFMETHGSIVYFSSLAIAFSMIIGFGLYRMGASDAIKLQDQAPVIVTGQIGTPVAEYMAPDVSDYVEAVMSGDTEKLELMDKQEDDDSERQL